jgi:hypothetical protein
VTIRQIREGLPTLLPHLGLADLPYALPSGVRLFTRGDQLGIEAQGLVGNIPLSNGDTLQILPKIGQANFLRMLFTSMGSQADLKRQFEEFVKYSVDDDASIPILAARQMVMAAAEVLRRGSSTVRLPVTRRMLAASGQILPAPTALALARHEAEPVFTRVRIRSHESPENRLVSSALLMAASLLDAPERTYALDTLAKWRRRVCKPLMQPTDLLVVEQRIARRWYGGPRSYYQRILTLGLVLLGSLGMTIDSKPFIEGEAVLLNSADIFEKYVRQMISNHYSTLGYIVTKGGSTSFSLYQDGTVSLAPDVVIERHSETVLIADAKYKEPAAADHYQMLAYLTAFGIDRGVLLTPGYQAAGVTIRKHATPRRLTVVVATLPMDKLSQTESFLQDIIDRCA